jgi:hypothetical protein
VTRGGFAACEGEIGQWRRLFPATQNLSANAIERRRVYIYHIDFTWKSKKN